MGALKRINGGIEKGQWGRCMEKGQVRQGLGFGPGRGVAVGQTGEWLWGCLTGL